MTNHESIRITSPFAQDHHIASAYVMPAYPTEQTHFMTKKGKLMITQSTKTKLMAMLIGTGMVAAMWATWGACPANAIVSTDAKSLGEVAHFVSASDSSDCAAGKPYCYETPVHLNSLINTPGFEGKPSLSADGLELYFVSDRSGALGGPGDQDIYVSRRPSTQEDWGAPERVPPPISSPFFDITPSISLDGLALYFASNRPGPNSPPWPDLWVSHRASVNDPWGEVVNLGPGVNTPLFEGSI